jgi:DNA gyrase subunit B
MFYRTESIFEDCRNRYPAEECELFLVEGESAAHSVAALRNQQTQAIFSMQGKPLNAHRATQDKVLQNKFFRGLANCINFPLADSSVRGAQQPNLFGIDRAVLLPYSEQVGMVEQRRYSRVLMLFDPDADGIHIGALMMMFFVRWMRPLVDAGVIHIVRAPMFEVNYSDADGEVKHTMTYSPSHNQQVLDQLKERGMLAIKAQHFRGLGSINPETLRTTCLDPQQRHTNALTLALAEQAVAVFSP